MNLFNFTPETVVLYSKDSGRPILKIPPEPKTIYALQEPRAFLEPFCGYAVVPPPVYSRQLNFMPPQDISVIVAPEVGPILSGHCKNVFSIDTSPSGCERDKRTGRILGTYNLIRY